jgi:predicted HTH domain antitoxin
MESMTIRIPNDLIQQLKRNRRRVPEFLRLGIHQDARIDYALELYKQNQASIGRAARLAGLTVMEMIEEAAKRGVEPHWNKKMIREELGE